MNNVVEHLKKEIRIAELLDKIKKQRKDLRKEVKDHEN